MQIEKVTGQFGARITGIDVTKPLSPDAVGAIRDAINEYGVLLFPKQPVLTAEQQLALAAQFGEIETPPLLTKQSEHPQVLIVEFDKPKGSGADVWHTDASHLEKPPMGTVIQAHILPEAGGDTCFSSMYSAYDALSAPMKAMLDGLTAQHSTQALIASTNSRGQYDPDSFKVKPPVSHPIVTVNPVTGRRRLFVNSLYTIAVDGMSRAESDCLLRFLFEHIKCPEFQLRINWSVGDLAFWDNLAVQHFAVADYSERRRMQRVTLLGDKPIGVREMEEAHEAV